MFQIGATHLTILFSDIIDLLCNYMVSIILSRPINFVVWSAMLYRAMSVGLGSSTRNF